ncbi:DMT family transporter [Bacillus sp. EB600]|uniref:DMT family transporter n=1 Tax=Bacillus sp. EB600 TaxID=2806345 RepID=UPI00210B6F68|nr:DMT family transporter [Bacillus sp. EB600]MCQ6279508.1 DMT family transporter [Bacillus sp. EB600]
MTHTKIKWILSLVIIMWGSNFVLTKILVEQFPFWSLLFFRNLFATIALIWFVRNSPFIMPRNKQAWGYVLGASVFGVVINNVVFLIGLKYTSPTNASLIMGLTPLVTALISFLVFSVPLNWKQVLGISLGFIGVSLVVLKGAITNLINLSFNIGDFYVAVALLTFSISFIFIKKATDIKVSPEIISFYIFAISSICYFPMSVWELTMEGWSELPTSISPWLLLLYLGVFPLGVGNMLWNRGISVLGPSQSAIFMNGIPLVAAIASLLIVDEPILVLQIVGFFFIGSGVLLGSQASRPAAVIKEEKKTSSPTM